MKKWLALLLLIPWLGFSQSMKNFELDDINGNTFAFNENLNVDATVVTFWATWCLPCRKEHPALQSLKEKYGDRLQIIAISIDSPRSLAKVKSYARSHDYDFVFLVDPDREVATELLVNEVPQTFVLDRTGKIVYQHIGYSKGDELELEKELQKLFKRSKK